MLLYWKLGTVTEQKWKWYVKQILTRIGQWAESSWLPRYGRSSHSLQCQNHLQQENISQIIRFTNKTSGVHNPSFVYTSMLILFVKNWIQGTSGSWTSYCEHHTMNIILWTSYYGHHTMNIILSTLQIKTTQVPCNESKIFFLISCKFNRNRWLSSTANDYLLAFIDYMNVCLWSLQNFSSHRFLGSPSYSLPCM